MLPPMVPHYEWPCARHAGRSATAKALLCDQGTGLQRRMRYQRANTNAMRGLLNVSESINTRDVDQNLGHGEPKVHDRHEALTTCQYLCAGAVLL